MNISPHYVSLASQGGVTIIRGKQATGKQPKIICTGCGNRAIEAGIAVSDNAVEEGYGCGPQGHPSRIMIVTADEEEMQPLCESCVTALEHGETKTADSRSLLTAAANLRLSTEMRPLRRK
jgi:hypothetical protein